MCGVCVSGVCDVFVYGVHVWWVCVLCVGFFLSMFYSLLHYFFTILILQAYNLISIDVTLSIAIDFPQHLTPHKIWN